MRFLPILILLLGVAGAVLFSSVYIIDERQQALVLEFGKVKTVEKEPGLKFKWPAPVNTVEFFDDRVLPLELDDREITPLDNRRLVVNAFARWRIADPQAFREAVPTLFAGEQRLSRIVNEKLRDALGQVTSSQILSDERAGLMRQVRDAVRPETISFGVEVVDVRLRRADLPDQNIQATLDRMVAERRQEAEDERARGREAKQIREAEADRIAVELESAAQRDADIKRGEADADRNRIFAQAYGQNPEFFSFYRSLSAYEAALQGSNSSIVLSPDSEFFNYLRTDNPGEFVPSN